MLHILSLYIQSTIYVKLLRKSNIFLKVKNFIFYDFSIFKIHKKHHDKQETKYQSNRNEFKYDK